MPSKKKPPKPSPQKPFTEYLNTEDACLDSAAKLNVVIAMIRNVQDPEHHHGKDDDDGGYGLTAARDMLYNIRDELRKAASASEAARGVR